METKAIKIFNNLQKKQISILSLISDETLDKQLKEFFINKIEEWEKKANVSNITISFKHLENEVRPIRRYTLKFDATDKKHYRQIILSFDLDKSKNDPNKEELFIFESSEIEFLLKDKQ